MTNAVKSVVVEAIEKENNMMYDWQIKKLMNGNWLALGHEVSWQSILEAMKLAGAKSVHIRFRECERSGHVSISFGGIEVIATERGKYANLNGWDWPIEPLTCDSNITRIDDKFVTRIYNFKCPQCGATKSFAKTVCKYIRKYLSLVPGSGELPWRLERKYSHPLCMRGCEY